MTLEMIITVAGVAIFLLLLAALTFVTRSGHTNPTAPIYELPTHTRPRRGQWSFSKAFARARAGTTDLVKRGWRG